MSNNLYEHFPIMLKEKYITDENGNRIGVVIELEEYHKLLEALEEIRVYDKAISTEDGEIYFEQAIAKIEQNR